MIYYSVQVDVVLNSWNGTYGEVLQAAMSKSRTVDAWEFYNLFSVFLQIVLFWVIVRVFQNFFIKHYVFRWRTAMNNYFAEHWSSLRLVEGAAQRVQEDSMKFAEDMESLGARLIDSIMTLIAFLPILFTLSKYVTELPVVGKVSHPLVVSALLWTIFGTLLLAIVGRKLPGLEFKNQRVEAAYRKELVYGEDDASRAQPPTLKQLFADVRTNYFKLYVSYIYFNLTRFAYSNLDNIFGTFILVPSLVTGAINLGVFNQISLATDQVRNSFQYLINVWPDLIKAYSTYKRLRAFEATIEGEELARIESDTRIT
jgi:peptide/bleomycin uptake transporter